MAGLQKMESGNPMTQPPPPLVNIDQQASNLTRERLIQDIKRLERQLSSLGASESRDASLEQTLVEMIHARQEMLSQLPRE